MAAVAPTAMPAVALAAQAAAIGSDTSSGSGQAGDRGGLDQLAQPDRTPARRVGEHQLGRVGAAEPGAGLVGDEPQHGGQRIDGADGLAAEHDELVADPALRVALGALGCAGEHALGADTGQQRALLVDGHGRRHARLAADHQQLGHARRLDGRRGVGGAEVDREPPRGGARESTRSRVA